MFSQTVTVTVVVLTLIGCQDSLRVMGCYPREDPTAVKPTSLSVTSIPSVLTPTPPKTFRVSNVEPEEHRRYSDMKDTSAETKIKKLPQYYRNNCTEILQMSHFTSPLLITRNGFVNTVIDAYNYHHNLIIRPDDVWGAIMTQFSFYMNKNAERFRRKFVDFEGKKELTVTARGSLRSVPYDELVTSMTAAIDRNLVDPEVKNWILPNFSTTTDNDLVTIGVVFMASMKKYFDYRFSLMCGIPWVTLEGTVEDWENVHKRLEKLKEYKLEKWYDILEPILRQFINAKEGKVDVDFWQKIAHHEAGGSGPSYISGWITAFCVFDADGNWQKSVLPRRRNSWRNSKLMRIYEDEDIKEWLRLPTEKIPPGIVEVDVKIDDNGVDYNGLLFAGHLATELKDNGTTVQPVLGWVMALKN